MVQQFDVLDESDISTTAMHFDKVTLAPPRRSPSASKRKATEHEQTLQNRQSEYQRKAEAYAKEREEADRDLDYSVIS
jgi:hypothetical protein